MGERSVRNAEVEGSIPSVPPVLLNLHDSVQPPNLLKPLNTKDIRNGACFRSGRKKALEPVKYLIDLDNYGNFSDQLYM